MRKPRAHPRRPPVAAKVARVPLVVGPRALLLLFTAWAAALALAFLLGLSLA